MENKTNVIIKGLGKLVHVDINEIMGQTLDAAKDEMTYSKAAVDKWKAEHDMFMLSVDEKIKEQKDAFDSLIDTFKKADVSLEKINKTMIGRYEKAVQDLLETWGSIRINVMPWFPWIYPSVPNNRKRLEKYNSHFLKLVAMMEGIGNMMRQIKKAFDVNTKFDKSSLQKSEFQPTYDFQEALKRSSSFMNIGENFRNMRNLTSILLPEFFKKMAYERDRSDPNDLINLLEEISFFGDRFVNQVCLFHIVIKQDNH